MANLKRTREDILEAVIDTIHRKGLTATGLSELFTLSGASSGSFYNYFESKQALGHALIDFEWQKLAQNVLAPAVQQPGSPLEQLFWMLDTLEAKQHQEPFCGGCLLGNLIVDLVEQDDSFREHLTGVCPLGRGDRPTAPASPRPPATGHRPPGTRRPNDDRDRRGHADGQTASRYGATASEL